MEVSEYEVSGVFVINEFEDEGMFYLLQIGAEGTLCLRGQYLYDAVESGLFPSSRIRNFWNKSEGFTYRVEGLGKKIIPQQVLKPLNEKQWESNTLPGDRDIIESEMDEVVRSIQANA